MNETASTTKMLKEANGCGLRIRGLTKSFPSGRDDTVHALQDFDLDIAPGEFVVIVGPNGSGKSTLLNILAGDLEPDRGEITLIDGDTESDWMSQSRTQRASILARVHQDPRRGTAATMTVWENLRLVTSRAAVPSPFRFAPPTRDRSWFAHRLNPQGLDSKMNSRVADLSQGQRQLLALELAMLREPRFLLADEHTASLDQSNAEACLEATSRLSREHATTVIMVTHNLMDAIDLLAGRWKPIIGVRRLLVLREGRVHRSLAGDDKNQITLGELFDVCGYTI